MYISNMRCIIDVGFCWVIIGGPYTHKPWQRHPLAGPNFCQVLVHDAVQNWPGVRPDRSECFPCWCRCLMQLESVAGACACVAVCEGWPCSPSGWIEQQALVFISVYIYTYQICVVLLMSGYVGL